MYNTEHDAMISCSNIAVHATIAAVLVAGLCRLTIHT